MAGKNGDWRDERAIVVETGTVEKTYSMDIPVPLGVNSCKETDAIKWECDVEAQNNVLYLGMAEDVSTPIQLVGDFDTIFTMNIVDNCYEYGGSIAKIKQTIRSIIKNGAVLCRPGCTSSGYMGCTSCNTPTALLQYPPDVDKRSEKLDGAVAHKFDLGAGSVIKKNGDTYDRKSARWELKFMYGNKERRLVYYFNRNFLKSWPDEIRGIKHVFGHGSWSFTDDRTAEKAEFIRKSIEGNQQKAPAPAPPAPAPKPAAPASGNDFAGLSLVELSEK
eukprot:gene3761-4165_t